MAITSDAGSNGAGVVATYIQVVVLAAQDAPDPLDPVFLFEAVSRYAGNAYDGSRRLVCSPMPASRLPFLPGLPEDQATMPVGMQAAPGATVDRTRTPVAAGADIPAQRHHPRPAGPPRAATTNPARALTVVLTHYLSRILRLPHRHSRYAVRSPSVRSAPHGSVPPVPHLPGPRLLLPTTWHSARIASTT